MDWEVEYDERGHFVRAEQSGTFSLEEQIRFLDDIFSHPEWEPGMPLMICYADLEVTAIDTSKVESVAKMVSRLKENLKGSRFALCCGSDVQFGLGRQFQMMAGAGVEADIRVFRDENEANEWLAS